VPDRAHHYHATQRVAADRAPESEQVGHDLPSQQGASTEASGTQISRCGGSNPAAPASQCGCTPCPLQNRRDIPEPRPTVERSTFGRPQRSADPRHDAIPRALFRLRIDQVEAMDRPAGVGGEIAPAVENEPLPGRGDREEGSRDLLVVQRGARGPCCKIMTASGIDEQADRKAWN
jgi:hypothetical protein